MDYHIIWEAPPIIKPEFRLYYDDRGAVMFYTCEKPVGNYIVIDAAIYAAGRPDVKIIDGEISTASPSLVVSKLMPDTHEAIRPSYMNESKVDDADTNRLYELIWKRTIASQMTDAAFEKTTAKIEISTNKENLTSSGEVMKFDGFLKVYLEGKDDDDVEESARCVCDDEAEKFEFEATEQ